MDKNAVAVVLQMLLCIAVLILNRKIFISGFKGLLDRVPNRYSLMALGSVASFIQGIFLRSFLKTAIIITLFAIFNLIIDYLIGKYEYNELTVNAPIGIAYKKQAGYFVYAVIGISVITFIIWMLAGAQAARAIDKASSVLICACPTALFISFALYFKSARKLGEKNEILFKDDDVIEKAADTDILLLDKTGIITKGEPVVTEVFSADSLTKSGYSALKANPSEDELIRLAGIMESRSEHPIAKAVTEYAYNRCEFESNEVSGFIKFEGKGLEGKIDGNIIRCGSHDFISNHAIIPAEIEERAQMFSSLGKTPIYYSKDNKLLGIIAVSDNIKENTQKGIIELKNMGINPVMLTGDNEKTAKTIAEQAGGLEVVSGIIAGEERKIADDYMEKGSCAIVLNDNNDDELIIPEGSASMIAAAFRLSKNTLLNIRHSFLWFLIYNIIMIPIAAGCLDAIFGILISPVLFAIIMCFTSLLFTAHALTTGEKDITDSSKDKKLQSINWRRKWRKRSRSNTLTISFKS